MSNPKEKAEELVNKFTDVEDGEMYIGKAKECALIAVDEILDEFPSQCPSDSYEMERHLYWQEVKQEIESL
jgi:hypothetical protein